MCLYYIVKRGCFFSYLCILLGCQPSQDVTTLSNKTIHHHCITFVVDEFPQFQRQISLLSNFVVRLVCQFMISRAVSRVKIIKKNPNWKLKSRKGLHDFSLSDLKLEAALKQDGRIDKNRMKYLLLINPDVYM